MPCLAKAPGCGVRQPGRAEACRARRRNLTNRCTDRLGRQSHDFPGQPEGGHPPYQKVIPGGRQSRPQAGQPSRPVCDLRQVASDQPCL